MVHKIPATKPIIVAEGITNRFGEQTVHENLDLTVYTGEILGLVGGSGSGKSVLLRTLTGLHQPSAGTVSILGKPLAKLSNQHKAATLGVLFQQGALFSGLTVLQNVLLPLREFTDHSPEQAEKIAREKVEQVGLPPEAAEKRPSELSGGMIKRAGLARALALDSKILFLDEPTAGLDPLAATAFDELIAELNARHGITVVMITHDLDSLFALCHRVAVLVDKQVTAGTLPELLKSDHPWIHEYFHSPRAVAATGREKLEHPPKPLNFKPTKGRE